MENGAEAVKATVEKVTAASTQAFREAVEKSLAGVNDLNGASKRNLEAVVESVTAATKGAEAVGAQTLAYAKKSWEDNVAAAQALSGAKSVQEVVELQSQWAKSAIETYLSELNHLTETVSSSVKDSLKPLNERVSAAVEKFQSAR